MRTSSRGAPVVWKETAHKEKHHACCCELPFCCRAATTATIGMTKRLKLKQARFSPCPGCLETMYCLAHVGNKELYTTSSRSSSIALWMDGKVCDGLVETSLHQTFPAPAEALLGTRVEMARRRPHYRSVLLVRNGLTLTVEVDCWMLPSTSLCDAPLSILLL